MLDWDDARTSPDPHRAAGFVAAFSGSHRYVLDYLTEEVLERQPEPVRGFLLETSVLERLSGAEQADARGVRSATWPRSWERSAKSPPGRAPGKTPRRRRA